MYREESLESHQILRYLLSVGGSCKEALYEAAGEGRQCFLDDILEMGVDNLGPMIEEAKERAKECRHQHIVTYLEQRHQAL
jgi:hypothetical protein